MRDDGLRRLPIPLALAAIAASAWIGGAREEAFEDYLRFMVRETAYVSSTFFLAAYVARPLREITGAPWAAALLRIRRRVGVAAALAHTIHFAFIVALLRFTGENPGAVTAAFGGFGFLVFWLMALTSNDASVRRLGARWKRLHRFGIHYLWLVFLVTYLADVRSQPVYAAFVACFAGAGALRMYCAWQGRTA
jgi:DMSO/TMAO reductase YedYZ heme-binding membrane subunit